MDYESLFGGPVPDQVAPQEGAMPGINDLYAPKQEYTNQKDPGIMDRAISMGAYPFQVAGGLVQGFANFVFGGAANTMNAEIATGGGLLSGITKALDFKNLQGAFLSAAMSPEELAKHPELTTSAAEDLDKWAKTYNEFSDIIGSHPLFAPEAVDKTAEFGEVVGRGGAKDVQGLMGAFTHWFSNVGETLGNKLMDAGENLSPEAQEQLAGVATAVETGVNAIPLLAPYFGKDIYQGIKGKLNKYNKANNVGDIANTAKGESAAMERLAKAGVDYSLTPDGDMMPLAKINYGQRTAFDPTSARVRPGPVGPNTISPGTIDFEPTPAQSLNLDSSRPGPMRSTNEATATAVNPVTNMINPAGQIESVLGRNAFKAKYMRENQGISPEVAEAAWNEYANKVTLEAYPDAYIAYEMKASGLSALGKAAQKGENPNMTGRQAYLNHIFDAKNSSGGYRNNLTLGGENYSLKDYITYTPSELRDAIGMPKDVKFEGRSSAMGPQLPRDKFWKPDYLARKTQDTYVEYINKKSADYGLEPVQDFNRAVQQAFEIRDMEFAKLKAVQEELAWKERYFQNELEPLEMKLKDAVKNPDTSNQTGPTSWRDARPSKEGPDYTSKQVQDFFDGRATDEIAAAHIEDLASRATNPVLSSFDEPWKGRINKGRMGKQAGVVQPGVFFEPIEAATTQFAKAANKAISEGGNAKETINAITRGAGNMLGAPTERELLNAAKKGKTKKSQIKKAIGLEAGPFSNTSRGVFNVDKKFLGNSASRILDSAFGELLGLTNAQEWLRKAQDKSPTLRRILDSFDRPFEGMGKAQVMPFAETKKLRLAEFEQGVKAAIAPLGPTQWGKYGGLSKGQNAQLNGLLRGVLKPNQVTPGVRAAYKNIRNLLDKHYASIKGMGIPGVSNKIGYLENYFHRSYNLEGKWKMEQPFVDVLMKHGIEEKLAREIFNNLASSDSVYRVMPGGVDAFLSGGKNARRASAIDYERTLRQIPDSELLPFLDDNVYRTLSKYNEEWSHRTTFAERYGANMEGIRGALLQVSKEFEAKGEQFPRYAAQHIYDLVSALDHNYKRIENRTMRSLNSAALTATNIALLPLVTLNSMGELLMPMGVVGMRDFVKAMPETMKITARRLARKIKKDIPASMREEFFEATGAAFEQANHVSYAGLGKAGGYATAIDEAFFKLVGLQHLTKFSKLHAVNSFYTHATGLMRASLSEATMKKWLKEGGFNGAKAQRLTEFMDYYGLDYNLGRDWVRKGMPKNHEFYPSMVRGALRFAEDAVLTPNPATLPLWYSNPHFALVKHLKPFTSLMFTRVMRRAFRNTIQHNAYYNMMYGPKALATATGMLAVGILINQINDELKYGGGPTPFDKTPKSELIRGVERVGFFGPASIVYDTVLTSKYGLASTIPGPFGSLAVEGSINVANYLKRNDSKGLAKFVASKASIFGKIQSTRDPIEKFVQETLQTMRPPKPSKDWRF